MSTHTVDAGVAVLPAVLPFGRQVELAYADQRAVVVEVGGGLRDYRVGSRALLDGYGPDERCTGARGQTLIPWPNRIRDGRYEFAGQTLQLPLTEPQAGNAIHGLTRWVAWTVLEHSAARAVLGHRLYPQPGLPVPAGLPGRVRARAGRAVGPHQRDQRGRPPLPVWHRRAPVPDRREDCGLSASGLREGPPAARGSADDRRARRREA